MEAVTAVIVAFIFACIALPNMVKNKQQFNAAIGLALIIVMVDAVGHLTMPPGGLFTVTYVFNGVFQAVAILMLVMSTGGHSLGDMKEEMHKTIDLVRRGGEEETIVIPLKREQPKERSR